MTERNHKSTALERAVFCPGFWLSEPSLTKKHLLLILTNNSRKGVLDYGKLDGLQSTKTNKKGFVQQEKTRVIVTDACNTVPGPDIPKCSGWVVPNITNHYDGMPFNQ